MRWLGPGSRSTVLFASRPGPLQDGTASTRLNGRNAPAVEDYEPAPQ
jgi:hypothetical protein